MKETKIFIGPMSKNIVDSVIEFSNNSGITLGLIPSRRQVEYDGGYVNNWKTLDFCEYVRSKTDKVLLVRDHSGPGQGYYEDDGIESFKNDCKYFDVVHVDVWKEHQSYESGLQATVDFINLGYSLNKNLTYEIGTEEAIRKFTHTEVSNLISDLKSLLPKEIYDKIKYVVIQSGTALQGNTNIGTYNSDRLKKMINIIKKTNLISKEHNGDYLTRNLLRNKFNTGLDSINVAPEFGQLETRVIIEEIKNIDVTLLDELFDICLESRRWEKWVSPEFNPLENKEELINICGHYVFSDKRFVNLKNKLGVNIDTKIKNVIKNKIQNMVEDSKINKNKLNVYFNRFSNKDITNLSSMFSDDVTLSDWDISVSGKADVIQANKNIFLSVDSIKVTPLNFYSNDDGTEFAVDIKITINNKEILNVVDLISFNNEGLIHSIKAYKK